MSPVAVILPAILFALLTGLAALLAALGSALCAMREMEGSLMVLAKDRRSRVAAWLRDPLAAVREVMFFGSGANFLLAILGLYLVMEPMRKEGWNVWLSALLIFGLLWLIVEVVPRALAARTPAMAAKRLLPVFLGLRKVTAPVILPIRMLHKKMARLFNPLLLKPIPLSHEELLTQIQMDEERGAISSAESALFQAIALLPGIAVKDVMTPRVDLPLMPHDAHDDEALNMLESARHPYVAVYDENIDAIAYLLNVRKWKLDGRPHWTTITQKPAFMPKTVPLMDAWAGELRGPNQALVVVDEHGSFEGMITWQNFVDHLLAKAAPTPDGGEGIQGIGPGRYLVSGSTRLDEVERELDVTLPHAGVDTIGGLVLNKFGYPPKPGERISIGVLDIKVKRTSRARVQQLELRVSERVEEDQS